MQVRLGLIYAGHLFGLLSDLEGPPHVLFLEQVRAYFIQFDPLFFSCSRAEPLASAAIVWLFPDCLIHLERQELPSETELLSSTARHSSNFRMPRVPCRLLPVHTQNRSSFRGQDLLSAWRQGWKVRTVQSGRWIADAGGVEGTEVHAITTSGWFIQ